MNARDRKLLLTIIEDIADIEKALKEFSCLELNSFLESRLAQKCVVMSLINVSEAIGEISDEFTNTHSSVKLEVIQETAKYCCT